MRTLSDRIALDNSAEGRRIEKLVKTILRIAVETGANRISITPQKRNVEVLFLDNRERKEEIELQKKITQPLITELKLLGYMAGKFRYEHIPITYDSADREVALGGLIHYEIGVVTSKAEYGEKAELTLTVQR